MISLFGDEDANIRKLHEIDVRRLSSNSTEECIEEVAWVQAGYALYPNIRFCHVVYW